MPLATCMEQPVVLTGNMGRYSKACTSPKGLGEIIFFFRSPVAPMALTLKDSWRWMPPVIFMVLLQQGVRISVLFTNLTLTCGVVFELMPTARGFWTEKVLYNFQGLTDGANPSAGVIFDSAGNLYGTTAFGGD